MLVLFLLVDRKDYCQVEEFPDEEVVELEIQKDYFQVEEFQDVEVVELEIQKDCFQVEELLDVEVGRQEFLGLPDFRQLVQEKFQLVQLF